MHLSNPEHLSSSLTRRDLLSVAAASALLLCIPGIAMLFSDEVNWGMGDFAVMGGLLCVTGTGFLFLFRSLRGNTRLLAAGLLLCSFLYVWAELAVGVFLAE